MNTIFMLLFFLSSYIVTIAANNGGQRPLADYLLDPDNYNQDVVPFRPTEVRIGIFINKFNVHLSEDGTKYEMSFYLRQAWRDGRLQFDEDTTKDWDVAENIEEGSSIHVLVSTDNIKNKIFLPDVFFRSAF